LFKEQIDTVENENVTVSILGQEQILAGDLQKYISGFQVLNPDLVICNLEKKRKFQFRAYYRKR